MQRPAKLDILAHLATALGAATTPAQRWQASDVALQALYGHRLYTILAFDTKARLLQRLYSSRPDINPVGGIKRVTQSPWVDRVLLAGTGYVGSSPADLAAVFSDHALLTSHGLGSVLNISVLNRGTVVGSLNLLDHAANYDGVDLAPATIVAQLLAAALSETAATLDGELPPGVALETV
ncbi:GAF domain-containing protein [Bordetella sp. LUAb4]|uniref:GAF domain-containing protein n=1 Tax=Bordetella sp. LUAb4 TaxID=2843195 RepID=UPI001E59B4EA|nr:GAF domain-containing protein [Bordetella sp. LUAb4]